MTTSQTYQLVSSPYTGELFVVSVIVLEAIITQRRVYSGGAPIVDRSRHTNIRASFLSLEWQQVLFGEKLVGNEVVV